MNFRSTLIRKAGPSRPRGEWIFLHLSRASSSPKGFENYYANFIASEGYIRFHRSLEENVQRDFFPVIKLVPILGDRPRDASRYVMLPKILRRIISSPNMDGFR